MSSESLAEKSLKILNEKSEKAISIVKQAIHEDKMSNVKVNDAIEKYLSRWNDTTRPGTLALSCEAAGGKSDDVVPLQVALLFFDATMDVHDDIIDESIAKRNVKTLYGRLGKETALLIGDAFMVKGFSHLHKSLETLQQERQTLIVNGVKDFLLEVVDAHILETPLKAQKWRLKPETYLEVLTKKAADIEGRMKVGALYGEGSPEEVKALSKYGRNLGILLAIRAEFVDMFEIDELANRVRYECLPLPVLYALQNKKDREIIQKILLGDAVDKDGVQTLLAVVQKSAEVLNLKKYLNELEEEAIRSLAGFKDSPVKSNLQLIVASMLEDL